MRFPLTSNSLRALGSLDAIACLILAIIPNPVSSPQRGDLLPQPLLLEGEGEQKPLALPERGLGRGFLKKRALLGGF